MMLHEVLLALSGHPSPLFTDGGEPQTNELFSLLSQSEAALLKTLGRLADQHRRLRRLVRQIASAHDSIICRAVATSIQQAHLARFQQRILDVESKILRKDVNVVGAYDIVPLATVTCQFDDWHRLMAWHLELACYIQGNDGKPEGSSHTTGAMVINRLREEANTGFQDVECAAVSLSKVAESAWLRQLSSWVLYGKLPMHGGRDFFIMTESGPSDQGTRFNKDRSLLPAFVTPPTAQTILFIGKSLDQVKQHIKQNTASTASSHAWNEGELAAAHLAHLSALPLPLQPAQLTKALSAIKLSLSQNVLQHLLPTQETLNLLECLRQYFLLGRGEFAVALIDEAERRLQARQMSMGRLLQQEPLKVLQGLSIKDAELQEALAETWKALSRQDEHGEDSILEFAMRHATLSTPTKPFSRPSSADGANADTPRIAPVAFDDLLFPSAATLQMKIEPPFNLFISNKDAETYAAINAYLLAIRRAEVRIADLWRRTAARRDHPSPSGRQGTVSSPETKRRMRQRTRETRKVWATCSAANNLFSETAAYLEGEIIKASCDHFEKWVQQPDAPDSLHHSTSSTFGEAVTSVSQRDPETLAAGHRSFLLALTYALLLTDLQYARELRSLLGNLDALIAYFNRLLDLQQKLDFEIDAGGASAHTEEDERRISLELDRSRKKVDSGLKFVINRLRQLDHERIGSARHWSISPSEGEGFEPWKGGGVDRLLMKLEFGRIVEEGYDIV
jgi:hypothetical protein